MTLKEFIKSLVESPDYQQSVRTRANAGTLPLEIELMMLEIYGMAEGRMPLAVSCTELTSPSQSQGQTLRPSGIPAHQGPALAFIRKAVEP